MECDHSLIADLALFAEGKILMVKYADTNKYDHQSGWFLPDDEMRHLEHPERAAKRIAEEQLGLTLTDVRLHHVESFKGNDGSWHLPFHCLAELDATPKLKPSKDVATAEWFPVNGLPPKLEVAHHGWALTVLSRMIKAR